MSPDGVFPGMGSFIFLDDQLLIHIHAKAGKTGQICVAIRKFEIFLIMHIVQHGFAHVIMDAHALLLDYAVIAHGVHLQAGGQGDGAKGTMGRKGHVICLGHGADFLYLRDTASVGQVGLDDIHAARLQKALEIIL